MLTWIGYENKSSTKCQTGSYWQRDSAAHKSQTAISKQLIVILYMSEYAYRLFLEIDLGTNSIITYQVPITNWDTKWCLHIFG